MAVKNSKSDEDRIRMLIRLAPELLAAGITQLALDGLSATFVAPVAKTEPVALPKEEVARGHIDPMLDPSTYPGGKVPGFTLDKDFES